MLNNAHRYLCSHRGLAGAVLGLALAAGCGSDSPTGGTGGRGTGGATGTGGAVASGGTLGSTGGAGTGGVVGTGGAGTGGTPGTGGTGTGGVLGSGGVISSGGANATGGNGGNSSGGAGGAATGGRGGGGGSSSTGGAGGGTSCAGRAISLGTNIPGGRDPAMARVVVDFGTTGTDLPLLSANRTIEFWAYMLTSSWAANTNTLFFYGPNPSARNADGFGLDFGANMGTMGTIDPFTNAIFDNDNQPSGVTTTTPQWVHFAMTWDGTSVRAFVNGIEKSTKTVAGQTLMTGRTPLTIGGYPAEGAYFNGYIDEFRVWNVAHTAAQIMSTMHHTLVGNEAGLTGYWKFDEMPGSSMTVDSVTSTGHTAHPGVLMASSAANNPTFITPATPAPLTCP